MFKSPIFSDESIRESLWPGRVLRATTSFLERLLIDGPCADTPRFPYALYAREHRTSPKRHARYTSASLFFRQEGPVEIQKASSTLSKSRLRPYAKLRRED